jgi:hypothetical protein
MARHFRLVAMAYMVLAAAVATAGCRWNSDQDPAGGNTVTDEAASIRRRDAATLPAVGEHLPPIDDGRLEAAPPEQWAVIPRGTTALMTFAAIRGSQFPRLTINAQDPPPELAENLTSDNFEPFLAWQDRNLRETGRQVWEDVLPIVLGENLFVRHVRRAEDASGTPLVIQSLQTVRSGRLYTLELIVEIDAPRAEDYEGSLTRWRDHAYAVAASMRFAPQGERFDPLAAFQGQSGESPPEDSDRPNDLPPKAAPPDESH